MSFFVSLCLSLSLSMSFFVSLWCLSLSLYFSDLKRRISLLLRTIFFPADAANFILRSETSKSSFRCFFRDLTPSGSMLNRTWKFQFYLKVEEALNSWKQRWTQKWVMLFSQKLQTKAFSVSFRLDTNFSNKTKGFLRQRFSNSLLLFFELLVNEKYFFL
jgi:hypothetical protein